MNAVARFPHFGDLLAIDPGCDQSGYVRIREGRILQAGVLPNTFMLAAIDGFFGRRLDLEDKNRDLSTDPLPPPHAQRVAIEQIRNMGMIVGQEVFDTVFFTGRMYERCVESWQCEPQLIPRVQIKTHLCGSARAKDANIRSVLLDRWGKPGTKKDRGPTYGVTSHAWSALAVASYALDNPPEPKS